MLITNVNGAPWSFSQLTQPPVLNAIHQPRCTTELGFPGSSDGKEFASDVRDLGSIPESGRSPEKEMATHPGILAWRLSMDRGACWATGHGVAKSQTRLRD